MDGRNRNENLRNLSCFSLFLFSLFIFSRVCWGGHLPARSFTDQQSKLIFNLSTGENCTPHSFFTIFLALIYQYFFTFSLNFANLFDRVLRRYSSRTLTYFNLNSRIFGRFKFFFFPPLFYHPSLFFLFFWRCWIIGRKHCLIKLSTHPFICIFLFNYGLWRGKMWSLFHFSAFFQRIGLWMMRCWCCPLFFQS